MKQEFFAKIKAGEIVYGTCVSSMAPLWGKAIRNAGLDFVFLDTEHIPLERMEIAALCQLYSALEIFPIVRIPTPDATVACQMLDAGAGGVLAPYIEKTDQVKIMVGALKYRPLKGYRLEEVLENPASIDPELKRYLQEYNRGNLCVINIESVKALENLDELLSVPGLDAVFIGPHDLSVSLGLPEDYDHPVFEKAVKMIIEKCRTHNVAVGIHFSETPDRQIQWIEAGVNIVIHSSDIAIFSQHLRKDIDQIRAYNGDRLSASSEDIII